MEELNIGDRVTPVGWMLTTPKPVGEVLGVYKHPLTGRDLVMVRWDDVEEPRHLSPAVLELADERPHQPNVLPMVEVIAIPAEDVWDCEACQDGSKAVLKVTSATEEHGYCAECAGPCIVMELEDQDGNAV